MQRIALARRIAVAHFAQPNLATHGQRLGGNLERRLDGLGLANALQIRMQRIQHRTGVAQGNQVSIAVLQARHQAVTRNRIHCEDRQRSIEIFVDRHQVEDHQQHAAEDDALHQVTRHLADELLRHPRLGEFPGVDTESLQEAHLKGLHLEVLDAAKGFLRGAVTAPVRSENDLAESTHPALERQVDAKITAAEDNDHRRRQQWIHEKQQQ
jgi:hypothetical protein